MEIRQLGTLWPVSALALGGAGFFASNHDRSGRAESVAIVRAAADLGVTLFDMAPAYGRNECEVIIGEAFEGHVPAGVRIAAHCDLGTPSTGTVLDILERSLQRSLEAMRIEHADLLFLDSDICPDQYVYQRDRDTQDEWATRWTVYREAVIPAMEALVAKGLIGAWGIAGMGLPKCLMDALREEPRPAVVQVAANLLDSAGDRRRYEEPPEPRNIARTAQNNDVGVMGVRPVQGGALTAKIDRNLPAGHPQRIDYDKAAPFRALCAELGEDPALVACRYAAFMPGLDSLVLSVKNVAELGVVVKACEKGPLDPSITARIHGLRLHVQMPRMPID